jgi:hypothetical protein
MPRASHPRFEARPPEAPNTGAQEVRAYLYKLIALILVGLLCMATAAVIAWKRFGPPLEQQAAEPTPPPQR